MFSGIDGEHNLIDGQGMFVELIGIVSEAMNFTIDYYTPPDGRFGGRDPDGSWNGMVGMLVRKEVDVLCGPLAVTFSRSEVIDYTTSFRRSGTGSVLVMKKGRIPAMNFWAYASTFTRESQAVTAASILALALGIATIEVGNGGQFSILAQLGFVSLLYMQRDSNFAKNSMSKKMAFLTTSLTGFLIFCYFSGMTTSLMTSGSLKLDIRSFDDIIPNDVQVGCFMITKVQSSIFTQFDNIMKLHNLLGDSLEGNNSTQ